MEWHPGEEGRPPVPHHGGQRPGALPWVGFLLVCSGPASQVSPLLPVLPGALKAGGPGPRLSPRPPGLQGTETQGERHGGERGHVPPTPTPAAWLPLLTWGERGSRGTAVTVSASPHPTRLHLHRARGTDDGDSVRVPPLQVAAVTDSGPHLPPDPHPRRVATLAGQKQRIRGKVERWRQ